MSLRSHVLVDIDNVLASAWEREHLISESWDAYHSASRADEPLSDIIDLVNALARDGFVVILLTGRNEKYRGITIGWLAQHGVELDDLIMRPDDDYRPAGEMKLAMALARFVDEQGMRDQVAFILDDSENVIKAFQGVGVPALQVFARRTL